MGLLHALVCIPKFPIVQSHVLFTIPMIGAWTISSIMSSLVAPTMVNTMVTVLDVGLITTSCNNPWVQGWILDSLLETEPIPWALKVVHGLWRCYCSIVMCGNVEWTRQQCSEANLELYIRECKLYIVIHHSHWRQLQFWLSEGDAFLLIMSSCSFVDFLSTAMSVASRRQELLFYLWAYSKGWVSLQSFNYGSYE